MEKEHYDLVPFLDALISKEGNRLGHNVYRKQNHTDWKLNENSNHHPSLKIGIIKTVADRARTICQPKYGRPEMKHLQKAFLENGSPKNKYLEYKPQTTYW